MKTYYVYLWLREKDGAFPIGVPYYVGKGSGDRAFRSDGHCVGRPRSRDYILIQDYPDEASAFAGEIFMVAYWGRKDKGTGCLVNQTDGGEGAAHAFPEYMRQKYRERMIGNQYSKGKNLGPRPPEVGRKISAKLKGNHYGLGKKHKHPRSPEHRAKLAAANRGRVQSAEEKLKRAESLRGQKRTPEQRSRMSLAQTGNKNGLGKIPSPETLRKRIETRMRNGGFSPSAETRAKISETLKGHKMSAESIRKGIETRRLRPSWYSHPRGPAWNKGKSPSAETRLRMREAAIGRWNKGKRKPALEQIA